jgi:hypothetical protein
VLAIDGGRTRRGCYAPTIMRLVGAIADTRTMFEGKGR